MFVQSTSRVGAIAELEIATAAVRAGLTVLRPVAEQACYDLALEIGPRLFRVQCKSGALDQSSWGHQGRLAEHLVLAAGLRENDLQHQGNRLGRRLLRRG